MCPRRTSKAHGGPVPVAAMFPAGTILRQALEIHGIPRDLQASSHQRRRDVLPSHHLVQAQLLGVGLPPHGPQQAVNIPDYSLCWLAARHRGGHCHIQQPTGRLCDCLDLQGTTGATGEKVLMAFALQQAMAAALQNQGCHQSCGLASSAQNAGFPPSPACPGGMGQARGLLCTPVPVCASRHPPRCSPAPGCSSS